MKKKEKSEILLCTQNSGIVVFSQNKIKGLLIKLVET